MPTKCYICMYYDPKKSLYRIPDRNDEYSDRSGLWLKLLEEKSENINRIKVCSDHFVTKKPSKSGDCMNIDWLPNRNLGRFAKNQKIVEYHFRKMKKDPPEYLKRPAVNSNYEESKGSSNSVLYSTSNNDNNSPFNKNNDRNSDSLSNNANRTNLTGSKPSAEDILISDSTSNNDNTTSTNNNDNNLHSVSGSLANILNRSNTVKSSAATRCVSVASSSTPNNNENNFARDVASGSTLNNNDNNFSSEFDTRDIEREVVKTKLIPLKKRKIHVIEQILFFAKEVQSELTGEELDTFFKYYKEAVEERNELLLKISTLVIGYDYFKGNDTKTRFYTGLTTWSLLKNLYEMIESALPTHFNCKLTKFQMLALTLMKLRLNISFTDIAYRFQISVSTASRYFHRSIYILFKLFKNSKLVHWPINRENLLLNTPSYFRSTFKELITVIVDCFELFIECPSVLLAAAQGFSQYKHHITLKYLIGISITGVIIFISCGYGGRASDKKVSIDSGFLDKLQEGDLVLADKGFLIENEVKAKEASLRIPCFVRNGNQLDPYEVERSRNYSSVRIHVERLISVLRQKFNICSDQAQMSAVSKQNDMFDNDLYDKIVFVCCCLVNICPSVVGSGFEI